MTPEVADHIARHPLTDPVVRVDQWVPELCISGCPRAAGSDGLCDVCYRKENS